MPFEATWMDLDIVILCEVSQAAKKIDHYDVPCMWILKRNDTNELTEQKDSQT